ncbi:MAG TPA: hypothetical protein VE444_08425 [Gaiellaceae bacterium]|nr:hypothetical protein [Gaiellaceae bacterium]
MVFFLAPSEPLSLKPRRPAREVADDEPERSGDDDDSDQTRPRLVQQEAHAYGYEVGDGERDEDDGKQDDDHVPRPDAGAFRFGRLRAVDAAVTIVGLELVASSHPPFPSRRAGFAGGSSSGLPLLDRRISSRT